MESKLKRTDSTASSTCKDGTNGEIKKHIKKKKKKDKKKKVKKKLKKLKQSKEEKKVNNTGCSLMNAPKMFVNIFG